jgi:hypothetical protein
MALNDGIDPNDKRSLDAIYDNITVSSAGADASGMARVLHHLLHTLLGEESSFWFQSLTLDGVESTAGRPFLRHLAARYRNQKWTILF